MQNADVEMFHNFCVVLSEQKKLISQKNGKDINEVLRLFIKKHIDNDIKYQYTQDLLYLASALADEVFLNTEWSGKKYWEEHMLEFEFFKTQIAGEVVFNRIHELLKNRSTSAEIVEVYLEVLAFGFQGKYREMTNGISDINNLREQMYNFIVKSKKITHRAGQRLFQEQYSCTLPTLPRVLLPDFNQLLYICLCFLFLFMIFGSIDWLLETKGLNDLLLEVSNIALRK